MDAPQCARSCSSAYRVEPGPAFGCRPGDAVSCTERPDLDFVALAAGQGVKGMRVDRADALREVLAAALQPHGPMRVEIDTA